MRRPEREHRQGKVAGGSAAGTGEGSGDADRADVLADAGRSAPVSQEPRRGLLCGIATGTEKLRAERTADAHQQGRRSVSANTVGAGGASHPGSVWSGQRPAALGAETGGTWREGREGTEPDHAPQEVGSVAASFVGKGRSVRTAAQQPPDDDDSGRKNS